jgi:hypothetical protein
MLTCKLGFKVQASTTQKKGTALFSFFVHDSCVCVCVFVRVCVYLCACLYVRVQVGYDCGRVHLSEDCCFHEVLYGVRLVA